MNIYRLGSSYVDIACAGQDDMLQLGQEESYQALLSSTEFSSRSKFESINNRYLSDLQSELEG